MSTSTVYSHHQRHASSSHHWSWTPLITHPIFLIVWAIICIGISLSLWNTTLKTRTAQARRDEAESRVKTEERRGAELNEKLKKAESDYAQEKIIRDELGMQKPGDIIIQVPKE